MSGCASGQEGAPAWCLPRQRSLALPALGLLLLSLTACGGQQSPASPESGALGGSASRPVAVEVLASLFAALQASDPDLSPEIKAIISGERVVEQNDPNWPTVTYLLGEHHRRRGDAARAKEIFSELASWAVSKDPDGPYGDTWGGSGLAALGLWRWLEILDEQGRVGFGEVNRVLEVAARLQGTRLYKGMVRTGLLPALPLLEEDVADRLAHVAWKSQRPEIARSLFLDFLTINSGRALDEVDSAIQAQLLEQGLVTRERLDLFRARRQLALVKTKAQKGRAAAILRALWDNRQAPPDVRAEAGHEWANYNRQQGNWAEIVGVLSEVIELAGDRPVAEKALYRRGMVHSDRAAQAVVAADWTAATEAFRADMLDLLRRFPQSQLADDALYQLATESLFPTSRLGSNPPEPDVDSALRDYSTLQQYQGSNDFEDSAYCAPALGLVGRGREGDLDLADRLFREYGDRYPNGVFRLRSLFWRGRVAELRDASEQARSFFQQVIEEAPYDYYAVRARMHLEEGARAMARDVPAAASQTSDDLRKGHRTSRVDTQLTGHSPYHERLRAAASSGLYRRLLEIDTQLGARLDDVPLEELDERGLIPAAALLLALRQDALAAKDSDPTASNWLKLAGLLGHEVYDWPVALEMTFVRDRAPHERLAELQRDTRYLATVYPGPANLMGLKEVLAGAAWPIGGSAAVSQSLMYATMRHESRFYPGAISAVGALGLFQFLPSTFATLKARGLLESDSAASDVEYLLDPGRNVRLWARWVRTEFARDGLAVAMMKHHAGSGNISKWTYWKALGSKDDIEYRIDTVRFPETRNFLRRVLQDVAIVGAAGFFDADTSVDRDRL